MQQPEPPAVDPIAMALRNIGATVAGIVLGSLIIAGIVSMGRSIYPFEISGEGGGSQFRTFLDNASAVQLLFPLVAYLAGSFAAAYIAHRLGRVSRPINSIAAAGFLAMMLIMTGDVIFHWFIFSGLGLIALGGWLGYTLAKRGGKGEIIV